MSIRTRKPLEPDIDRCEEFEPRLPSYMRRQRGSVLSRLKFLRHRGGFFQGTKAGRRKASGSRGRLRAEKTFSQRVMFKARVVAGGGHSTSGGGAGRMRAHVSYLCRSGTSLHGEAPEFFSHDPQARFSRQEVSHQMSIWANDPHHFRFIISPEHSSQLDLPDYIRAVLKTMEGDLKTKLQWYAICHYNTDNPHAHVTLRGVDEQGKPLVLDRDYISHGIRHILQQEATVRLGVRQVREVEQSIERHITEERFTFLDKELLRQQGLHPQHLVELKTLGQCGPESTGTWQVKVRLNHLKRLVFLQSKGLAHEVATGVWKLSDDLEQRLRELAYRRKIERLVSPYLKSARGTKTAARYSR